MSKVNCKDCQFYHNGKCEELGEYTTPGECECSWFAPKAVKTVVLQDNGWRIIEKKKQSLFDRITQSPEVLAEKLVYRTIEIAVNRVTYSCWKSTITEEAYRTKAEAIAATVAKLN